MLISLDYDLTYTADPEFWDAVVLAGKARGHQFVCVTGRAEPPQAPRQRVPDMPIVCAPHTYKRGAARRAGYFVDVWIDDSPGAIESSTHLRWD